MDGISKYFACVLDDKKYENSLFVDQKRLNFKHLYELNDLKAIIKDNSPDIIILRKKISFNEIDELINLVKTQYGRYIPFVMLEKNIIPDHHPSDFFFYFPVDIEFGYLYEILNSLIQYNNRFTKSLNQNRNIIGVGGLMRKSDFQIKTLEEARDLSLFLGMQFPDKRKTPLGCYELLLNAIEHGNLGIGLELKESLVKKNMWKHEVNNRLTQSQKMVHVIFERKYNICAVKIIDEGDGFDWKKFLEFDYARSYAEVGRGIMYAKQQCFDDLRYNDKGNEVLVYKRF